ncbi:BPL-N domain-containing protein [Legionella cardiaca]|uniref:Biotin-protein ligase N-terminal domain-containing protein n=1 Tax=Legionella cardiaca TaxID=1071983 RepID=A0ABY8ANY1_9GAMM|nr:BPL-N domain-containing protein [Legionella cardiaca]WED41966.1 hypothetical protein PXX05_08455 [Legionella cardiaca]
MTRKVFIYNDIGTGPNSTSDIKELFTSKDIFSSTPDVLEKNFDFNMDGLSNPVFVVPGGSTTLIGHRLKPQMDKIKIQFKDRYGYVGVCAGAYLGVSDAELFHLHYEPMKENPKASFLCSTNTIKIALDMINDYGAFGAFYPNEKHRFETTKELIPYRVSISSTKTNREFSQLYVAGPAFYPIDDKPRAQVMAYYKNSNQYTLFSNSHSNFNSLPAIICRAPTEKSGGKFLAATHIETCIKNSKLLRFFKQEGLKHNSLQEGEIEILESEQELARGEIELMLKEALSDDYKP